MEEGQVTTPQNPFAQPDKGDRFVPRDHPEWLGKLFLIYPDSVTQQMGTGPTGQPEPYEAVEADIAIVDLVSQETGQPTVLSNARVGGKALVPQIKKHCGGGMVLGRLAQTAAQGQKSGAFYLAEYSDADAQMAMQYIAAHPRNQFTQPTAQQAPAQSAQYAQQQYGNGAPQGAYGQGGSVPQGQPQYAAQQLPYGAPAQAPQGAPAGPPQQQWGAPPAAPPQAPAAAPGPTAPAPLDPQLADFLRSKGVNPEGMSDGQARMIAQTFSQ